MNFAQSTLLSLAAAPQNAPVGLLLRHAQRYPITDPEDNLSVPLTPEGIKMAEAMGSALKSRYQPGRIYTSPALRCQDTAAALLRGASWPGEVQTKEMLGYPYVAGVWQDLLLGLIKPNTIPKDLQQLIRLVTPHTKPIDRLDIFVTHDTILACLIGVLWNLPIDEENWPDYLEGMVIWKDARKVNLTWRGKTIRI